MSRIVVDISDLRNWHGNLSGIQRVVYELAIRYEADGAALCYYDEEARTFYKAASIEAIRPKAGVSREFSEADTQSLKSKIKQVIYRVAPPFVWDAIHDIRLKISDSRTAVNAAVDENNIFQFLSQDQLTIFGAHWDKPNYIETVKTIKSSIPITVAHLINDLIPVYDRAHTAEVEHDRFPKYMIDVCEVSNHIFLISKYSLIDFRKFMNDNGIKNKPSISIVSLGEDFKSVSPKKPQHVEAKKFLLNVGTVEVRKNPILLYQIYKLAKQRNIELPPLYIVGRKGWLTDEAVYQITYDQDVCNKIFLKHDINDAEMSWLYQNCEFFLFPSYYEGWGLPVAEAAHFGKMSIASNTSSIPEVVGEAAVYASPYDAALWLKLITSMLSIDNRQPYERALRKRKRHSWDETYAQTRQI